MRTRGSEHNGVIAPMLAVAGAIPPADGTWAYEAKWDGMRAILEVESGLLRLRSRTGRDITQQFPELADPVAATPAAAERLVVDGEIVVLDDRGVPSFHALQTRMHLADAASARSRAATRPAAFIAFDLLWGATGSVMEAPYDERRSLLVDTLVATSGIGAVGSSAALTVPPVELGDPVAFASACRVGGLEGIVAKKRTSPYQPGRRSGAWVKSRFVLAQEFVVIGWTEGTGTRRNSIGALLLGYHDESGGLRYAGKVGTGFSDLALQWWRSTLDGLATTGAHAPVPRQQNAVRWVLPALVVQVGFAEWSPVGHLRHPTYLGLRDDIAPASVRRET